MSVYVTFLIRGSPDSGSHIPDLCAQYNDLDVKKNNNSHDNSLCIFFKLHEKG